MNNMTTDITTLEYEVDRIRAESVIAYNAHRDAVDRLYITERKLAEARKNGDN
jgi:hypothetical protein